MDIDLLGPLEVRDRDGLAIRVPAGRERALLALLAIHCGEVVSTDRIVNALWGASPPGTAGKAVQGYVSHLRRLLGDGALVTRAPGYALEPGAVALDADCFARAAAEGRRALEEGSHEEAARRLGEALALWRGPALAEFRYDDFAREEAARLEESRVAATEDRMEALLALGRHAEVTGELGALVAANPYRERLRGQWMRALYLGGRQSDALAAHREGRRLLADELGIEPGPELQRLERMILNQDAALGVVAPAPAPPAAAPEPEAAPEGAPSRRGRGRAVAVAAAVVAVAAAIVIALALMRDDGGGGGAAASAVTPPAVIAVDPATNRIVASLASGSKPASLAAAEGTLWVGDARDATVARIDPVARRVVRTIGIGAAAIDLAAAPSGVWVATGGLGQVVQVNPSLDAVSLRVNLSRAGDPIIPSVGAVAAEGRRVWAGAFDGMVRLDAVTGDVTARVNLGSSAALQIAPAGEAVWATTLRGRAKRVDTGSARVTGEFYAGAFVLPVAVNVEAVWLGGGEGALWRIDPVTGAPTRSTSIGEGNLAAIALGAGSVWVASQGDDALLRVNPRTGGVVARVPLPGTPQDVALAGGLAWVAIQEPVAP